MSFSFQPRVKMRGKCVWGKIHFTALAKCPNSQSSSTHRTKFNSLNNAPRVGPPPGEAPSVAHLRVTARAPGMDCERQASNQFFFSCRFSLKHRKCPNAPSVSSKMSGGPEPNYGCLIHF